MNNNSFNQAVHGQPLESGSSQRFAFDHQSTPTQVPGGQPVPVAAGAQPIRERGHPLVPPLRGIGSGFISSGPQQLDQPNHHLGSSEYQQHVVGTQSQEHNFNPKASQHYMSHSQNTVASLSVSPNQTPNPPQPRNYVQNSAPRMMGLGSASEGPLGSQAGHPHLQNGAIPVVFRSQDSSQFSLVNASTEEHLQIPKQISWLAPPGKELFANESPAVQPNMPRYMTQSQMKVMQQSQAQQHNLNKLKNNQSQAPIHAGSRQQLMKKKNTSSHKPNVAPRGALTARAAQVDDYQSAGRIQTMKAKRGDRTERTTSKNAGAQRKRDNSDLQVGRKASSAKRGSKSRNRKQPRSGSNRGKKQEMADASEAHRHTYEGDLRQQDQELRNDSDIIEDSYEILQAQSLEENYNSPNFQMIHNNDELDRQDAEGSASKKVNILIDVQNQHQPMRSQQIGKHAFGQQHADDRIRLNNTFSDAHEEKNFVVDQSLNTMSIQEQHMNGPPPNESLINTISIQESATMKSKNGEKFLIDKFSQIESKRSLNSKGSATVPGALGNDHQNHSLHNLSSPTKGIVNLEKKVENQLSMAAALANVSSNNKIDQLPLADPTASNAFQKLESQTLRDMLMKNNLSSRDQKEFQKEFDEFQEELRKRSSESRTPEQMENQLSKSHNYMSEIGEGAGRGGRVLLGRRFTPGLSNGSDSQTMRASLGLSHNFKKKSVNVSIQQWNQMNQQKQQAPPNQASQSQQLFTDAMRLGSAINQMLNVHKKKNNTYRRRYFDIWKLQTLLTTPSGKAQKRKDATSSMASIYQSKLLLRDQSKSSSASGLIHIIHQTRPIQLLADGDLASSVDQEQNASQDLEDVPEYREMRAKQENELKLRKAILAMFRFKARQTAQRFHQWKYQTQFEKRFQREVKMMTEMLERKYAHQQYQEPVPQQQHDTRPNMLLDFKMLPDAHDLEEKHAENLSDDANEDVEDDEEDDDRAMMDLGGRTTAKQQDQLNSAREDRSKAGGALSARKSPYMAKATHRVINQMHAKLPFSGGESKRNLKDAHRARAELERAELMQTYVVGEDREDAPDKRVALGLVPSKDNKSKQLTQAEEQMFKQILQSSQKNFANLLNQDEKSVTGSMSMLPAMHGVDNEQSSGKKNEYEVVNRHTVPAALARTNPPAPFTDGKEAFEGHGAFNQPLLDYQDELLQELRLRLNLQRACESLTSLLVKSRERQFLINFVKTGLVVEQGAGSRNDLRRVRTSILQLVSTGAFKNLMSRSSSNAHCQHFEYRGLQRMQILEVLRPVMLSNHSNPEQLGESRLDLHPLKAVFHLWQLKTVLHIKGLKRTLMPLLRQMKAQQEDDAHRRVPSSAVSTSSSSAMKKDRNIDCLQCFVELHDLQQDSLRAIGVVQGIIRRSQVKIFAKYFHRWLLQMSSTKQEAKMIQAQNKFGTELQAELHQKMILKLNHQKHQCDSGIARHYQMHRRTKMIIQKFHKYQELKRSQESGEGPGLEAAYQTAGLKSGLSLAEFEHLVKMYPDCERAPPDDVPPELLEKMKLYQSQMQLVQEENTKAQVEVQVRQMCYDMMVKVLEVQGQEKERKDFRRALEQEMEIGHAEWMQRPEVENPRFNESGRQNRKYQGQGSNQPRQMHKY